VAFELSSMKTGPYALLREAAVKGE
jgi:hypothetical protein